MNKSLKQYEVKKSPKKIKLKLLDNYYNGKRKDLALDELMIAKLHSRFPNATPKKISLQAARLGLKFLIRTYRMGLDKGIKRAWLNLIEKDLSLENFESRASELDIWSNVDCYQVLLFMYGHERIDFIEKAWQDMHTRPFQRGWHRCSFRAPKQSIELLACQIELLECAIDDIQLNAKYYELPKIDKIRCAWQVNTSTHPYEWTAELDLTDNFESSELFCVMRDIVYNRDETGKVSRDIIKALLASRHKCAWALVKDMLISAQRQEGLRETILECLDDGSRGAIPYFIDVILDNNLTRFSSVVRALDVWTGMNWSADKPTTAKKILESAQDLFKHPERINEKITSLNNTDVLMALWVTSIDDIEKTIPMIYKLIEVEKIEKVCLAMYFVSLWNLPSLAIPLYQKVLESDKLASNLHVLAYVLPHLTVDYHDRDSCTKSLSKTDLFSRLEWLLSLSDEKSKSFDGKVFNWLSASYDRQHIFNAMVQFTVNDMTKLTTLLTYRSEMQVDARDDLVNKLLYKFKSSDWAFNKHWSVSRRDKTRTMTAVERKLAFSLLDDRGEHVGNMCAKALIFGKLSPEELPHVESLFTKKSKLLNKRLLYVMLGQPVDMALTMAENLIQSENTQQRVAGLELAFELQDEGKPVKAKVSSWVNEYRARATFTKVETAQLELFDVMGDESKPSAENGYHLYDSSDISPFMAPKFDPEGYFARVTFLDQNNDNSGKFPYGFSKSLESLKDDLKTLSDLFKANLTYEYEVIRWNNEKQTIILGENVRFIDDEVKPESNKYKENFPLWEKWNEWYQSSNWKPQDLFIFNNLSIFGASKLGEQFPQLFFEKNKHFPKKSLSGSVQRNNWGYQNMTPLETIIEYLQNLHPFEQRNDYLIHAAQCLYSLLDENILQWQLEKRKEEESNVYSYYNVDIEHGNGWQSLCNSKLFLSHIDKDILTDAQITDVWHLYRWRQMTGKCDNIQRNYPPLWLFAKAFRIGLINRNELMSSILLRSANALCDSHISLLSSLHQTEVQHPYHQEKQKGTCKIVEDAPLLMTLLDEVREFCLDVELKRGEVETPVTSLVADFNRFYGVNRLVEAMVGLDKKTLYANHIYQHGLAARTKRELFSYIIQECYPRKTDCQADFDKAVKDANLSDEKLVQIATYAPQWLSFISTYLQWEGLESGIWWLNAHTKTSEYEAKSAREESEIAKYSTIDLTNFKMGAVDIEWFNQAHSKLGKKRWSILYDCAKFISEGNGHRRAKLYSDVLTGELKIREVTKKVKDNRDQDHVRLYGLVPLSKKTPEKDVLTRYQLLQQFKKESKQFGSQRQTSEGLAVNVAMDNLARTAGYPDPLRLSWAMESQAVQAIFESGTVFEVDEIRVELVIDADGKTDLAVEKAGITQKSIPAKYRKTPEVEALKAHKKTLTEQFRRARISLEEAMTRGDSFTFKELSQLFEHPVITKLLQKIVFISDDNVIGFYEKEALKSPSGEVTTLSTNNTLRIAHCVDLHSNNVWRDYQSYCFESELKQPFKQMFRELYVPTADELRANTISKRYAGHQVQPSKTVALLKSRGWRVDYEEGLQKVFHTEGFRVKLYAMADWFSPADIESPTLETVEFERLSIKKGESYNVAFTEINPRTFSEVMRDIDLVVSIAHVGEVDPEASQSSIELRAVLLEETLRLFKLKNVKVQKNHAIIDGRLGNYGVHLGSAVAHQIPGAYLSILPVHSQHRGRIFLPFMDEDPKTAELMAKVLLLAKDNEIQDPTVLRQISLKE